MVPDLRDLAEPLLPGRVHNSAAILIWGVAAMIVLAATQWVARMESTPAKCLACGLLAVTA